MDRTPLVYPQDLGKSQISESLFYSQKITRKFLPQGAFEGQMDNGCMEEI